MLNERNERVSSSTARVRGELSLKEEREREQRRKQEQVDEGQAQDER